MQGDGLYLDRVLARVPLVLSLIDREPFSKTYGSGDRVHWCWKFTDFPGARFQEYIFTLAWLYSHKGADNPWRGNRTLLDAIIAGLDYWCKVQYADGSFDEAYPFEHSLAATAFTVFYLSEAYELVAAELPPESRESFRRSLARAGQWLCANDEHHGILSNHLAAAAAACCNAGRLLDDPRLAERARHFRDRILRHQSSEGWYEEYGGADIGYQTHGSFYLARLWQRTGDAELLESLRRANRFLLHFIHPDGSVGGEYASRNTTFYFPAAFEILSGVCPAAAMLAREQRDSIRLGRTVGLEQMDSYNLYPMLNNYLFAHDAHRTARPALNEDLPLAWRRQGRWEFPQAGLLVQSTGQYYAVVGGRKGGVVRAWDKRSRTIAFQSAGYVAQSASGWTSSNAQGRSSYSADPTEVRVDAPFTAVNQKLFNPPLFLGFRVVTLTAGRFPGAARWVKDQLVRVLVRKQRPAVGTLQRKIEFSERSMTIRDTVSADLPVVRHLDKFCTFHMGSSRYVHVEEEQIRGRGYHRARLDIDNRGVVTKAEVLFDEG